MVGVGTIATWVLIAVFIRYSSLAALVAAAFAPLATVYIYGAGAPALAVLAMAVLLVWRHKQNIARLLSGTEPRIGAKKPDSAPSGGAP
jgi:glycerol-3-phosphate acyltransferase PlsY